MKRPHDSLSILLCVRNCQSTLVRDVERLVEMAAELHCRFELLVVDDGSNDATEEVAWELSTRFASVRLVRHAVSLGPLAALRTGLAQATGDFVLVHNGDGSPQAERLAVMWRGRHARPVEPEPAASGWLERLRALTRRSWLRADAPQRHAVRLFRRADLAAVDPLAASDGSRRRAGHPNVAPQRWARTTGPKP